MERAMAPIAAKFHAPAWRRQPRDGAPRQPAAKVVFILEGHQQATDIGPDRKPRARQLAGVEHDAWPCLGSNRGDVQALDLTLFGQIGTRLRLPSVASLGLQIHRVDDNALAEEIPVGLFNKLLVEDALKAKHANERARRAGSGIGLVAYPGLDEARENAGVQPFVDFIEVGLNF